MIIGLRDENRSSGKRMIKSYYGRKDLLAEAAPHSYFVIDSYDILIRDGHVAMEGVETLNRL